MIFAFCVLAAKFADAASFYLSPSGGTFTVDSTFDVSIFLDTRGESVNAVDIFLKFPPDKLQLVSPAINKSVISIWVSQPKLDNRIGTIKLEGIIQGGIITNGGLITRLTFRVKSVGSAIVKFLDDSKTLLNDGLGTNVLENVQNAVYQLVLPPPAGPIVISETHPNQSNWYSNSAAVFKWASETDADGYSYVLNDEPIDFPDDISEGVKNFVAYKNMADGQKYFHIKSLRNGAWGGTTHFSVKIDSLPPAEFPLEILPASRSTNKRPVIQFATTDSLSGISHYELKIVSLGSKQSLESEIKNGDQEFFIETESPYITHELELGAYDVIIRAYDKSGNYREVIKRISIVNAFFKPITDKGLEVRGIFIIDWIWVWIISAILLVLLGYLGWRFERWHHHLHLKLLNKDLPEHVKNQINELKKYRSKYSGTTVFLLIIGTAIAFSGGASAQEIEELSKNELSPPIIATVSKNISNDEIFYIGGKTEVPESKIIIYLQNPRTGETTSQSIIADKKGDWFYRHNVFLSSGDYILWTQNKIDEQLSPPSFQIQIKVQQTAIQFGASRISYEVLYLMIVVILLAILVGVVFYIAFHGYHARKKHKIFVKEALEAEESVRRGFAVLRRDIEVELAIVKKAKLNKNISAEEKLKEEQLLKDLESIEKYIGKEIWDVKAAEHID